MTKRKLTKEYVNYSLADVWQQQNDYNELVMTVQERSGPEWMINYILGTMSELGELLEETNWKKHRLTSILEFGTNIPEQLADITKYVFSMWQVVGYNYEDMLEYTYMKGEILSQLFKQEMRDPPINESVILLDLDGVVANFRQGFYDWLQNSQWAEILSMGSHEMGMNMDVNNGWDYRTYEDAKLAFEGAGGYKILPPIRKMVEIVQELKARRWYIIAYTARPYKTYRKIWADTWTWLQHYNIEVDELHFGHDARVAMACKLAQDNLVIAIEDNPSLIQRYMTSGIQVLIVPQPYNQQIVTSDLDLAIPTEGTAAEIVDLIESTL